jgi:hypothetical protein
MTMDDKQRIGELRQERIDLIDARDGFIEEFRDDLATEMREYLRQVNNEIVRLLVRIYA